MLDHCLRSRLILGDLLRMNLRPDHRLRLGLVLSQRMGGTGWRSCRRTDLRLSQCLSADLRTCLDLRLGCRLSLNLGLSWWFRGGGSDWGP